MLVIVNADDFGMSAETNAAILRSFELGVISSTTLMANMPGFEAAAASVAARQLQGRIGVHLNLTQGPAVSTEIRRERRLCDEQGAFRARPRDLFRLSASELAAVAAELRAQIRRCIAAGVQPSHVDSHHHSHTSWAAGTAAIAVARELGIPHMRPAHNAGTLISTKHKIYSALFNRRLDRAGLRGVRHFCSLESATAGLVAQSGSIEIMVHPFLHPDGRVTDFANGPDLTVAVPAVLGGVRPMSYAGVAAQRHHDSPKLT